MTKSSWKEFLCAPLRELYHDAAKEHEDVLPARERTDRVHNLDRPTRSYVLVDVPTKARGHQAPHQAEQIDGIRNKTGDTA